MFRRFLSVRPFALNLRTFKKRVRKISKWGRVGGWPNFEKRMDTYKPLILQISFLRKVYPAPL